MSSALPDGSTGDAASLSSRVHGRLRASDFRLVWLDGIVSTMSAGLKSRAFGRRRKPGLAYPSVASLPLHVATKPTEHSFPQKKSRQKKAIRLAQPMRVASGRWGEPMEKFNRRRPGEAASILSKRLKLAKGQTAVEFAMVSVLFFMLLFLVMD